MKKVIVLMIAVAMAFNSKAQSILGIPFGSSYGITKEFLEERFGKLSVFEEGGKLSVMSPVIGGHEFKFAEFYFQKDGPFTWLSEVLIQTSFETNDTKSAKYIRDDLADIMREKYEVGEYIGNNGFKGYWFGTNPKDEEKPLGYIFITRTKGRDGKQRLYLILHYGPIYYADRSSDF